MPAGPQGGHRRDRAADHAREIQAWLPRESMSRRARSPTAFDLTRAPDPAGQPRLKRLIEGRCPGGRAKSPGHAPRAARRIVGSPSRPARRGRAAPGDARPRPKGGVMAPANHGFLQIPRLECPEWPLMYMQTFKARCPAPRRSDPPQEHARSFVRLVLAECARVTRDRRAARARLQRGRCSGHRAPRGSASRDRHDSAVSVQASRLGPISSSHAGPAVLGPGRYFIMCDRLLQRTSALDSPRPRLSSPSRPVP